MRPAQSSNKVFSMQIICYIARIVSKPYHVSVVQIFCFFFYCFDHKIASYLLVPHVSRSVSNSPQNDGLQLPISVIWLSVAATHNAIPQIRIGLINVLQRRSLLLVLNSEFPLENFSLRYPSTVESNRRKSSFFQCKCNVVTSLKVHFYSPFT